MYVMKESPITKFKHGINMSLVMRKPVFGVSDQLKLESACSAAESS